MGTVTLRPSATLESDGVTVTGAATAHQALADDSDVSYIDLARLRSRLLVGMPSANLPAGAAVRSLALRLRTRTPPGTTLPVYTIVRGSGSVGNWRDDTSVTTWTAPITFEVGRYTAWVIGASITPSDLESVSLLLSWVQSSGLAIYEAFADVVYAAKPQLVVDAPAGTVSDTNLPTVSWVATLDPDGGPQWAYGAKIFTQDQYEAVGFDPLTSEPFAASAGTVVSSDSSWLVNRALPDGVYRAYVRIAQQVNGGSHPSDWVYSEFTIDVALPGPPTLALTPQPDRARIRLDIACDTNTAVPSTDRLEIQRSIDGGASWHPIRWSTSNAIIDNPDATVTVYDFEAPNGADVTYRVRAAHDYNGQYAASDWVQTTGQWADDGQCWLVNPYDPSMSMRVTMQSFPTRTRSARAGVVQPLGARTVSAAFDTRGPETGPLVLRVPAGDHAPLDALLDAQVPLLLIAPAEWPVPFPFYFAVTGDLVRTNPGDKAMFTWSLDTLTWTRVPRPPGGLLVVPA